VRNAGSGMSRISNPTVAPIAEQFLLVADGGVARHPSFRALVNESRFRNYLGPDLTRAAETLA
jgi:ABC-2 type transport system ATP-binding protein